jgi:hypothetical protein
MSDFAFVVFRGFSFLNYYEVITDDVFYSQRSYRRPHTSTKYLNSHVGFRACQKYT